MRIVSNSTSSCIIFGLKVLILLSLIALVGCPRSEHVDVAEPVDNTETNTPSDQIAQDNVPSDEQFEQWQKDSFLPVIEKWLKGAKLPPFVELKSKDPNAGSSQLEARIRLLDVNGDGKMELAMQSGCAAVGNCGFWLFQKDGKGYKQLLDADMVQMFELRKTRSNNYYDLETSAHGSSTSGGIAVYKFNGTEYKIAECFGYVYERTGKFKNGQALTRDKPTLTPADCAKWPSS